MGLGETIICQDGSVRMRESSMLHGTNDQWAKPDELEEALKAMKLTGSWKGTKFRDPVHIITALKTGIVVKRPEIQQMIKDWESQRDKANAMFKELHARVDEEAFYLK